MASDIAVKICADLRAWINHTKEGAPRAEKDLVKFDNLWNFIRDYINKAELMDIRSEEENDFLKMVKYTGKLYRFHKKYDKRKKNFGVRETSHCVSWTKSNNINNFYWMHESQKFITIVATADENNFGIDLVELSEYMQKYYVRDFKLGTPAILREQEVVFPIDWSLICNVEINPNGKY